MQSYEGSQKGGSSSSYVPLGHEPVLVLQPEMVLDTPLLQWVGRTFPTKKSGRGTDHLLLKRYEGSSNPNALQSSKSLF